MSSLIWLKKISVLLFTSFLLMIIGSLRRFPSFILSFFCTNNLCSVDVSVSVNSNINDSSINIFHKNFDFSFYNSTRLPYEVRKYQKFNLLAPEIVVIVII